MTRREDAREEFEDEWGIGGGMIRQPEPIGYLVVKADGTPASTPGGSSTEPKLKFYVALGWAKRNCLRTHGETIRPVYTKPGEEV